MIEKAGGSGSITPKRVSAVLKASAPPRDVDLFFSKAEGLTGNNSITITAQGENFTAVETALDSSLSNSKPRSLDKHWIR